jgi:uncharacterized protein
MKRKKVIRILLWSILLLFLLLNGVAYMHAYKFTHFADPSIERTPKELSFGQKLGLLFTGVDNPKPLNKAFPNKPYQVIKVQSNVELDCWFMKKDSAKGTVLLFHGYGGEKSSMLDKAEVFLGLGYNTMLVDFMGSGGSGGRRTTIGFEEAIEVRDCYNYLINGGYTNIHLFGTSMGAVAIMKAIKDYNLQPKSIIIECPFGSMYKTVCARFETYDVPTFPMAGLLMFWGGTQNGFWAFSHNPTQYAKSIQCPTLLLYGEKDERVSREEIDAIFSNLKGNKKLIIYPFAGHENYLLKYRTEWTQDVRTFLQ